MREFVVSLKGLSSDFCAGQIEDELKKIDKVKDANVSAMSEKATISIDSAKSKDEVFTKIQKIVTLIEPNVIVAEEADKNNEIEYKKLKINLKNINCAHCANQIEEAVKKFDYIRYTSVNMVSEYLLIEYLSSINENKVFKDLEETIKKIDADIIISLEGDEKPIMPNKKIKLLLEGMNCADCANKIEESTKKLPYVKDISLNFVNQYALIDYSDGISDEKIFEEFEEIVKIIEPDISVSLEDDKKSTSSNSGIKIMLAGLNCADCANKIEEAIAKLPYINDVSVNFVNQYALINHTKAVSDDVILREVKDIVSIIEPDVKVNMNLQDSNLALKNQMKEQFKKVALPFSTAIISVIGAFALENFTDVSGIYSTILYLIAYAIFGFPVIKKAINNIKNGQWLDENFLMSIATIGAIAIKQYPEAVAVMFFYQIGEFFQEVALNNSRSSIKSLLDIKPDFARILEDGKTQELDPAEIEIASIIQIRPGERVPLDGIVTKGEGQIDTKSITGEPVPVLVRKGSKILSGSINLNSVIEVETTETYGNSTISKILEMVEYASNRKAGIENFITKFSKIYTPVVVAAAVLLATAMPIISGDRNFYMWLERALIFLVVSCPCAMVVSVPLTFFSGIGEASKRGVLVKGGNFLQALSETDQIVMDKTGTVTEGNFVVSSVDSVDGISRDELLEYAAIAESSSNHPIALSIVNEYAEKIEATIDEYNEIAGKGILVKANNEEILAGNMALMNDHKVENVEEHKGLGSVVYIAVKNKYIGKITIEDELKPGIVQTMQDLRDAGIKKITILTGDKKEEAEKVASILGVDDVRSELLPHQKVEELEKIMEGNAGKTAFVGDGLNDAPVLKLSDVGIALGGIGSEAAIEAADIILMTDKPQTIVDGIKISRSTMRLLKQNIVFTIGTKFIVLGLSAFGLTNMAIAIFADVGVTLIAILNAMRKKI